MSADQLKPTEADTKVAAHEMQRPAPSETYILRRAVISLGRSDLKHELRPSPQRKLSNHPSRGGETPLQASMGHVRALTNDARSVDHGKKNIRK